LALPVGGPVDIWIGCELPVRGFVYVPVRVQEEVELHHGVRAVAVRLHPDLLLVVSGDDDHSGVWGCGAHAGDG
jgi:hypothetical protein